MPSRSPSLVIRRCIRAAVLHLHIVQKLLEGLLRIRRYQTELAELSDQLGLTVRCDFAVARKGREHHLVPEVLAPGFELFRRVAEAFTELR